MRSFMFFFPEETDGESKKEKYSHPNDGKIFIWWSVERFFEIFIPYISFKETDKECSCIHEEKDDYDGEKRV